MRFLRGFCIVMISARAGSDLDSWQRGLASLAATAFGVAFLASAGAAIAAGPFDGLSRRWSGTMIYV
jgi:hypothetical protein